MYRARVIPCLLLRGGGLVKSIKFKRHRYLGDPINAVKIFNEKEVDELVFLDITASREGREPPFELLAQVTSECFMPVCYGGGVRSMEHIRRLFGIGVEKVALNTWAVQHPDLVSDAADQFGAQSVIVSIDVKRRWLGRAEVRTLGGTRRTGLDPVPWAREMERRGAGELLLTSIDRDGTMAGYDLALIRAVAGAVSIPVVACGGAGRVADLVAAVKEAGASAAAAGSMFVYQGPHRAVLINYPSAEELRDVIATGG